MRLLIFGINYSPELTGIGKYTSEMCEWLAKNGNEVSVITANPYYPEWKIHAGYKNRFSRSLVNKVNVYRSPLYIPANATGLKRILHELSFVISASFSWIRLLFIQAPEIIICVAPPFHSGIQGLIYRFIKGGKLVYHIQDLQVDAAQNLSILKGNFLLKIFYLIEKVILRKADMVSSISEGMINRIKSKVPDKDCYLLPNWVDTDLIRPLGSSKSLRQELSISQDEILILYSGNLGEKQGLDIIIPAAKHFENQKNVKFVICGSGAYKDQLVKLAYDADLQNIKFYPLQPLEKLSSLLNSADIHLILQKKAAADLVLPSKLTGIASAGGFSIVAAEKNTTLYNTVVDHNIGLIIEPEDVNSLVEALSKSINSDLSTYKSNARKYAMMHLNKDVILTSFLNQIKLLNV